jgi:hypothetical protein
VAIATAAGPPAAPPPNVSHLHLGPTQPGRDADVPARRPTIEAQFVGGRVDPNSLHITLDDLDITSATSRSPVGFVYSPPSDLESMRHFVRVRGTDVTGAPFEGHWSFTSGTSAVENRLEGVVPPDGASVPNEFTVSGRTLPHAQVIVQVGAAGDNPATVAGAVGAILGLGGGASVRNEVTANDDGTFSTVVSINAPPGTTLRMIVSSTEQRSRASAHPVARTLTIRP